MRILILSEEHEKITKAIDNQKDTVIYMCQRINLDYCRRNKIDFIISYGYRYIIDKDIVMHYKNRAINLHISYLPFAKGAHPVFWSIKEKTPTGVSIHQIEKGLDTGAILVQEKIELDYSVETFRTSYIKSKKLIEKIFLENWDKIRGGELKPKAQEGKGTYHRKCEIKKFERYLINSWDTNINQFFSELNQEKK